MRLLLYNIRYGLGLGSALHWPLPGMGYFSVIAPICSASSISSKARIPTSWASSRSTRAPSERGSVNQAEPSLVARALLRLSVQVRHRVGESALPILRKQGNAFLAAPRVHGERFHYFEKGIKRLIIELELETARCFSSTCR